MSAGRARLGVRISTDQLPVLLDVLRVHPVDVCITDTSDTAVLDVSWRPWARRVKPWLHASMGASYMLAPMYTFPDPQYHARQRQIIAEQLQHVIESAVYCEARGIIIPIESLVDPFQQRLKHYLDVVLPLLEQHQLQLVVTTSAYCTAAQLRAFATQYDPPLAVAAACAEQDCQHFWLESTDVLAEAFAACPHTGSVWLPTNEDSTVIREQITIWGTPSQSDTVTTRTDAQDDLEEAEVESSDEASEGTNDNSRSS